MNVKKPKYSESMKIYALRRRSEEDRDHYRNTNKLLKNEAEELMKDNNKLPKEDY